MFSKGNIRKKTQSWCKSTSSALLSLVSCLPNIGSKKLLTQHRLTFVEKLPMAVKNCINSDLSKNYPRRWELGRCVALGEGSDRKAVSGNYDWTLAGNESIRSRKSNSFFVAHPSSFFCCNCSEKIIDVISFQHCYSKQGWYHFQSAPITDQERCQGAKVDKNP